MLKQHWKHRINVINKIEIDWLDSCPKCDCSEHVVETVEGTKDWLYNGDKVTCGECGHTGEIEADGETAWVDWDDPQEPAND